MSQSLPACARLHPGVVSEVSDSERYRNGAPFRSRHCRVCRSLMAQMQTLKRQREPGGGKFVPARMLPYGVIALSWTPPERMLGESP